MSDFKQIISYLKFFRRTDEAKIKNKHKQAIVVDEKYKFNVLPHEDDFIFVEKRAIENQDNYIYLGNEIEDFLYLQNQPNGDIEYYIKRDFQINNEIITKYRRIPFYLNDSWEEKEGETFIEKETPGNYYYSQAIERIIETFLDDVFMFPDYFIYHPNDLQGITNNTYIFNYKDEEGYTTDLKDLILREIISLNNNANDSETKRTVGFQKNVIPGFVFLFPKIRQSGKKYFLQYTYYQKGISFTSPIVETAIQLEFNYFGALLEFLNQTIFYELNDLDVFNTTEKKLFLEEYAYFVEDLLKYSVNNKILEVLYYVPVFFFKKIDINFLWNILYQTLEYVNTNLITVTNIGLNKEDIVLHLLNGIYESSKKNNIFLQELINRKTSKKKSLLQELILTVDGENYKKMVYFLWNIWKNSDFSKIDSEKNKFIDIADKNPILLDYRTNKKLGFHTDNAKIDWNNIKNAITVGLDIKSGKFIQRIIEKEDANIKVFEEEIIHLDYEYHPLSPLAIIKADNPTFILKDEEQKEENKFTFLPAFVLFANNESAFWENVITSGEYAIDIVTTFSGVTNILKVGRLAKILKAGHSLIGKTKAVTTAYQGAKAVAGVVEVTAGVGNALLKLLDLNDTELGREIARYLFYLEMLSLSGELSVALYSKLQTTARKIVVKKELLVKTAKNADEAKQIDEIIEHLEDVAEVQRKLGDFIMHSGDDISESLIKNIVKQVRESTGLKNFDIHLVDRNNEKYRKLFEQWQKGGGYGFFKPSSGEFGISLYKGLFGEGPQIYMFAGKTVDEWGVAKNVFFTKYTTQHELFHVEMFMYLKNKTPNYMKFWAEIPNYMHEQYVLNRLLKTKNWKKEDLLSDLNNINSIRKKYNPKLGDITLKELETWKFEIELEKIGIKIQ